MRGVSPVLGVWLLASVSSGCALDRASDVPWRNGDGSAPDATPTPAPTAAVSILSVAADEAPASASADPNDGNDSPADAVLLPLPYDRAVHRLSKPRVFSVQVLSDAASTRNATVELFFGRSTPPVDGEGGNLSAVASLTPSVPTTVHLTSGDLPTGAANVFARVQTDDAWTPATDLSELALPATSDNDWFRVKENGWVSVELADLPANYDVEIYNGDAFDKNGLLSILARGQNGGTANESLAVDAQRCCAGNLLIRVFGPDGASSIVPYRLKIGPMASLGID